jgi:hypothetical protein
MSDYLDCGDNSCMFRDRSKPSGMRTNGGCSCFKDLPTEKRMFVRAMYRKLAALREENEQLRANALVWHKWPENTPRVQGLNKVYLTKDIEGRERTGFYWPTEGEPDWMVDGCDMVRNQPTIMEFAEIPKPEGEES